MVKLLTEPTVNRENFLSGEDEGDYLAGASFGTREQADNRTISDLVLLFKLFADETRLRILVYLMQHGELNVRTLCEMLGQSQPAVSHHLALLRANRLIESRRDGKHNFYRVLPERFEDLADLVFRVTADDSGAIRFENFALERVTHDEEVR